MTRRKDQAVDELRTLAEALRLRIVESGSTIMVLKLGTVIYRSSDPRDIHLYLEMQRASA